MTSLLAERLRANKFWN